LQIIATLGLWNARPLDESDLLASYAATRPQPPDWTDRRALASAVRSILYFMQRCGHIAIPHEGEFEERWRVSVGELAKTLDWLDLDWLGQVLVALPQKTAPAPEAARNPDVFGATPNQSRLLVRLRQILAAAVVPLDRAQPDSESNALRLFAALAAAEPEIAAHPATPSILKLLLAAWAAIECAEDPIAVLKQLRAGRILSALPGLTPGHFEALRATGALGSVAADVIHELMANSPIALHGPADRDTIYSACAGLFLLVRAITEVRITPPAPVLFALGLQWFGTCDPDPGLALWSGLAEPEPAASILNRLEPAACDSLLARVRNILEGRASIDPRLAFIMELASELTDDLTDNWPSDVERPPSIRALAVHLLRLWSRWLRGFAQSSVPYLLQQFIRRPGEIELRPDEIVVILRPAPLDLVLEMSGYLAPTPAVPWLAQRRVSFRTNRRLP